MAITAAELMVTVGADTTAAQQGVRSFGDQLNSMSRNLGMSGMALSAGVTAPVTALGMQSLMTAADFETSMNRVSALSGATGDQFDALRAQAMDLGATTQFSASQAADAMGFLAMAGFKADEILGAMPSTLQLAAAAQLDMGRAADITSNIMTGYGLTVEDLGRVNDVLVASFTNANTDLSMLGEAMKYAGPVASGMGMTFEEAAAAISLMGNAGIQASMAGTALRGILVSLANPTSAQQKIMEQLGLTVFDSAGNMLPLVDIMGQLETSGADAATIMELFGQRAGPAMLALVDQGSGALADFTAMLLESGGTAERIADVQMMGLNGVLEELRSTWEGVQIAFADMGGLEAATDMLKLVTQAVRDGFTAWTELDPALRNGILAFGAVFVAAGPVLLALAGITAALAFLLSPIGLVVVASAGLAAAWASDFGGIRQITADAVSGAQTAFTALRGYIQGVAEDGDTLNDWLTHFPESTQPFIQGAAEAALAMQEGWGGLSEFFAPIVERLTGSFGTMIAGFGDLGVAGAELGGAFGRLGEAVMPLAGLIGVVLVGAVGFAMNALGAVMERLPAAVGIVIEHITAMINTISTILEEATALVLAVIDGDWDAAWAAAGNIVTAFGGLVMGSLERLGGMVGLLLGALKDTIVTTLGDFGIDVAEPFGEVERSVREFWSWLTGLSWDEVWSGLGSGFAGLIDTLTAWVWPDLSMLTGWGWPRMPDWTWPSLPRWTWPSIPTPGWLDNLLNWRPSLPFSGNAVGSSNFGGGLTWVGERGPELVALPGGSRIYNHQESMALAGGGGVTVQIMGPVHVAGDMDIELLALRVGQAIQRRGGR